MAELRDRITLTVGGRRWRYWYEAEVVTRLGSGSGRFTLTLDERADLDGAALDFTPGAAAVVSIDGAVLITGPIVAVRPRYEQNRYRVVIEGWDQTGQMVKSAALNRPGEWRDVDLGVIARDLAEPFGVSVRVETDLGAPFAKFTLDEGETAIDALRRACMHRGVLYMPDGLAGLLLTTAGAGGRAASIEGGRTVLSGEGIFDDTDRHSEYIVRGQNEGVSWSDVADHAAVEGRARDPNVALYSPTLEIAAAAGDVDQLTRSAEARAAIAAGRSRGARYGLPGWRGADGHLWRVNRLTAVRDRFLKIDRDMLIEEVRFSVDGESLRTDLSVVPPAAWRLEALPETEEDVGW